ncbi:Mediator of RNA polymerase II transcription subunit 14 [Hibiscus syriacus]|uniref:Mediator of RNA polymerase II transcription subunit 14 n=1 Tax=Hibiscus syriacus TaxID=106335 RepID=A0A6A2XD65_HIBSY|nr:Mediator of RNA polymerase II transcription subunit 14 [Hibiscus syriacus]
MAELGQQTVGFSSLVSRTAEESFTSLKELVEKSKSGDQSDTEKKINLLKYIVKTQQRVLRLNVLAKWCQQVPLIHYCQQLTSTLSSHETCFTQAADSLFFMHEGLQQARAPVYDVPSSVEVLLTGSYERLPKCIEDVGMQSSLTEDQQKSALKKLDTLVRSKLLEATLPKEISEVKVADGTASIRVDGEFKVLVTLGYRGHLSLWRILHLELLVGERSGLVKLEEMRRHVLGDDLERRMSAAENPFATLYSVLHELCVALVMDTVIRQVQALRQGRWRDAIRFEMISDGGSGGSAQLNQDNESDSAGLRTPGLKLVYWLDSDKNSGASDSGSCPYIKIEHGPDLQIKCQHSTFAIDPITGEEACFFLDQSCIDVEKLLLRAISCNRYTRLLKIQKELMKNVQICRDASDVVLLLQADQADSENIKDAKLDSKEHWGQELLRVRVYGSSFFTLGINIRNGRFLLRSSQNILAPSALLECEETLNQGTMTAADVFTSLRSKSIVHLFAAIGRFLGLEVYEPGFAAVKVPKNLVNGSDVVVMGFPECESSYFLLMELDKDFNPVFKLLETRSDSSGKGHSFNDLNNVLRIKKIDISQMQMLEDETNLSILDWGKLVSSFPNVGRPNQISEHDMFNLDGSMQIAGGPSSSFSSIVDEVFEIEKGTSATPFPSQNFSSFSSSLASHLTSVPMNLHGVKAGNSSPNWEAGLQVSQHNNFAKSSGSATHYDDPLYPSSGLKSSSHSASFGSLSSGIGRITSSKKLSASKSEQDLASLRSRHSVDSGVLDEDQLKSTSMCQLLSPPRPALPRVVAQNAKPNGPRSSSPGNLTAAVRFSGASPLASPPYPKQQKLQLGIDADAGFLKRRKISDVAHTQRPTSQVLESSGMIPKSEAHSYGYLIAEANKGNAPSSIYVSALLHVVRHSSLCIKHAKLTIQMEELDIPYVEEVCLRNASSNIWFRLPCSQGDSWRHICLRLGRPGSMYWDVKINDQHFRDLWELQKGSTSTPWGSGIRIANTSHVDSHISYDPDGVVLSYHSVEVDSIKKLVADIRRLSNARTFSLGMWKLLGVRAEDKPEEGSANSDLKAPIGGKGAVEAADKLSEQMRRSFRIEAVGLLSLWFCFGSGVLARFVVEWESGKEGCTMHVSPNQLWPHTKNYGDPILVCLVLGMFLEDFIDGAEVASLLDCIRLTAGPLHALAAATRPARASPAPVVSGVSGTISSVPKQSGYTPLQGFLPSSSTTNVNQAASVPAGNTALSASASSMGNHSLHGAAILAASGRGGPGIVPSSLLPIDVSVVLRGPYWIRLIYRKRFAVDMRCFAGDQVWLQPATPPATPPRGGTSVGGSLPCPQFRPFIMEHVAQELNGLDSGFTSGQQTVGLANSNNTNLSSGPQLSGNGNRVNVPTSAAMSRAANQVSGFNRVGSALPGSPNLAVVSSGLPIRRPPGSGVPAHVRGELNTAIIGLGDDGGYGGGWVPVVALKKVLRGILKYLGVLWLFAQLPELLKEILGSILKDNEGALLNLDQEQPALRFFVGGYVFAVSVHRVQLLLQVLSVKRFHHQQQQQQQQNNANAQEELTQSEISEICDYFSRRVASEPYDASRVASFITLLTLPISVLREFLKLIAWKKGLVLTQSGDIAPAQKPRIELCLENHTGVNIGDASESSSATKSNIHYDRPHNSVDFTLTVVLDPAHIPHINTAGGAAWLPYCVAVRLRYSFGENHNMSFLSMEGSHGGRACWFHHDGWEKCKQRVARTIEVSGSSPADATQGRLRTVADNVQRALICAFKD